MRIVQHFIAVSEGSGGVSAAVLDLVRLESAAGHDVILLTASGGELPGEWRRPGDGTPRVETLDPPTGPLRLLSRASLERTATVLEGADILHLHGMWRPSNYQIASLARRLGVPYVMSTHGTLDDWSMRQSPLRKRLYLSLVEGRNLAGAGRIHATASEEANEIRRRISHDRVSVIPCAFDSGPFESAADESAFYSRHPEVDPGRPSVVFVGRLHRTKGVEVLIEAMGLLARDALDAQLLIAGPAEDPAYLLELEALAAAQPPAVHFLGAVGGAEKFGLYRSADVFALPSRHENFGLVIPEALASETPVVTTRGTQIWAELESGGASLIVERTPEAFAAAIAELLRDEPRRRRLGAEGRRWVLEWLEPRRILEQYEELYRQARMA